MPHESAAFLLCIFFVYTFWYARLDSNQRPSESELSGRQKRTYWGARVSVGLHNFGCVYRKCPEPLQCNGSGRFLNSRQIVVSRSFLQALYQPLCRVHAVLRFSFRHRHVGIRWIACFNVKLIYIGAVPKDLLQRGPRKNCLSAQKYETVPLQEFARIF